MSNLTIFILAPVLDFFANPWARLVPFLWFICFLLGNTRALLERKWSLWESVAKSGLVLVVTLLMAFTGWVIEHSIAAEFLSGQVASSALLGAGSIGFTLGIVKNGRACLKLLHTEYTPAPAMGTNEEDP